MSQNGTAIKILVGATIGAAKVVDGLTSNDAQISRALRDTTNKSSGGWKAQEYGLGEGSFSVNANYNPTASSSTYYRWQDFLNDLIAGNKITVWFTDNVSGNTYIKATCLVQECPMQAPQNENATYNVTLAWDGAPTIGTV